MNIVISAAGPPLPTCAVHRLELTQARLCAGRVVRKRWIDVAAATREERLNSNDPRLSIAERYPQSGDRASVIAKAAKQLVEDRLLLPEDVMLFTGMN
jgi:hypothetical protein